MRLYRSFIGYHVVFPFQDVVADGTLRAVERTGYIMVEDAHVGETPLGTLVVEAPKWMRKVD